MELQRPNNLLCDHESTGMNMYYVFKILDAIPILAKWLGRLMSWSWPVILILVGTAGQGF